VKKKLLILQLNEINFDIVKLYSERFNLPNFKFIFDNYYKIETSSEKKYENLEPWIQWVSFYTGKSYSEHKVFYLNELKDETNTIFKYFDKSLNLKQFLMLPMNLKNNLSNKNSVFIPDPWTETNIKCENNLKKFFQILKKIVLNNKNINLKKIEIIYFLYYIIFYTSIRFKFFCIKNLFNIIKKKYFKAIIFDNLISDIFYQKIKSGNYDVCSIFLNSGAHIQHHYMLNSYFSKKKKNPDWYIKNYQDPIYDYLKTYDNIIENFLKLKEYNILLLTGLSQSIIDKPQFYYNLKNPFSFFSKFNIYPEKIIKRMSRDYTLKFDTNKTSLRSYQILKKLKLNQLKFFDVKLDGEKIFLETVYPREVNDYDKILYKNISLNIKNELIFLAIKNTIHNEKGYCFSNFKLTNKNINIKDFYNLLTKKNLFYPNSY
jgi:hypothetical protein